MRNSSTPGRRLVALDVGARRVGVAVSDELGLIASPVEAVDLKRRGIEGVAEVIARFDPERVIVGLPRGMSGREGPQAAETRAFAAELAQRVAPPIVFWDERLTTAAAEQTLIDLGHRRRARKQRIDAVAAALILQSYLDAKRR